MTPSLPKNPWDAPCYPVSFAAHLIRVPVSTLRAWVAGRSYKTKAGTRDAPAVIPQVEPGYLSFTNLVEAYVLAAMRREYQLKLDKIRTAVAFVEDSLNVDHPLARQDFKTDGLNLFVEHFGSLLNVSQDGQVAIREAVGAQLERVEYENGLARRLFPRVRSSKAPQPRLVVIDPTRAFGQPVLSEAGVPVASVVERFRGGDSATELAEDFGVRVEAIEEALRAA